MKDLFINYFNLKNFQLINLNKIRVSSSGMQRTMLNKATTICDELVNDFISKNGQLKKITEKNNYIKKASTFLRRVQLLDIASDISDGSIRKRYYPLVMTLLAERIYSSI